jgi:ADP-ribosylglycohydrolase
MLGAIVGDIAGLVYEFDYHKSKYFPLFPEDSKFPDDTILTVATAGALLEAYQRLLSQLSCAQNLES